MADYLVFRLYGPLASWGEIAVGETRHSATYPSRSALLGLLAAALGIRRNDTPKQEVLNTAFHLGIKLICAGAPLRDYHTVQTSTPPRKGRYYTRRHELSMPDKVSTMLTSREYRCDNLSIVALQVLTHAPYTLMTLKAALERPHYPLYLGRKSCPLALPVDAQIATAASLRAALDDTVFPSLAALGHHCTTEQRNTIAPWPTPSDQHVLRPDQARYYWDEEMENAGMPITMTLTRYDQPLSRERWQFMPRRERVHLASPHQEEPT